MATKFTAGPWSLKTRQSAYRSDVEIEDGICGADGEQIRVFGVTLTASNEARANARLIAGAPELLEALRGIVDNGLSTSRIANARAAIAKATGE